MARKKTITEFQEEQPEDMTMPVEGTGEDDPPGFEADTPSVDAVGEGDAPFPMAGEDSAGPDGFPPDDGVPFEGAVEGDTGENGTAGVPPIEDVVRGIDNADRTVVGSRRDAMRRKRKRFYLDTDKLGRHMIEEGSVVQARVVAVAEKALRVEVFGVECNVAARGSSWLWAGSVRDRHYVGEIIPVRVLKIDRINVDRIAIQVDARDVFGDGGDNLSNCQPQCRYVGQVTDMRRGVVYVRLNNGVNAIAHTCYDARMPGRKDTVSFAVTRLDEAHGIAIGIITRIIKQNL